MGKTSAQRAFFRDRSPPRIAPRAMAGRHAARRLHRTRAGSRPRGGRRVLPHEGQRAVSRAGRQGRARSPARPSRTDKAEPAQPTSRGSISTRSCPASRSRRSRRRRRSRRTARSSTRPRNAQRTRRRTRPRTKAADKVDGEGGNARSRRPPTKLPERFWLQAGSFTAEADAENLKARLAFAGWQANVQQGTLPDKGIRYRVRLGPYDNTDELNRIRNDLAKNGFDVAVIKF